jgi:hypothetical protein
MALPLEGRQVSVVTTLEEAASGATTAEGAARFAAEIMLIRASHLVRDSWCRRGLAQDAAGRQVEPWCESAARWSPLGALLRVWYLDAHGQEWGASVFKAAYGAFALATGGRVEEWNAAAWREQRHVVRAFARARSYVTAGDPRA